MKQYLRKFFLLVAVFALQATFLIAAVPSGYYYFAKNKKKAELKTALREHGAALKLLDYGGGKGFTWEGFYSTDNKNDTVVDMYSNIVRKYNGYSSISGMNIEHSFPKSWWGASNVNAYRDLFHLYPADDITNITKSNLPLGEVTGTPSLDNGVSKIGYNGFQTAYTDKCFEPADEFKGDFARSYFYISTIYEEYANLWQSPMMNNNTYPVWKPWAIDLLMKWNKQDPVSAKEIARIEAVYKIQGNRNPFIDYPDLADYIWGADSTQVFPFPEETQPFLLTPRVGASMDFGVILQNGSRVKNLLIQGVNINANLQLSLARNNAALSLSTNVLSAQNCLDGFNLAVTYAPTTSGVVRDTLLINGGGLTATVRIPLVASATAEFIALEPTDIIPVGGALQWISEPDATDYLLSLYQGDVAAGDLFFSSYVEGTSWNKAYEIYNGTGKTVDLSKYTIQKQSDGSGNFGYTIYLSGMLENNKSYILVNSQSANTELGAYANRRDSLVNFNGNDAVALLHNGVMIDVIGVKDAGASLLWGLDVTLQRKSSITHPQGTYDANEWNSLPIDTYNILGKHSMDVAANSNYVLQNFSVGNSTSYTVQGLTPQNKYTYKVEAVRPTGNVMSINSMQIHTSALDVPVLMDPSNITSTQFVANWEETLYATGYLLNVMKFTGHADVTIAEGFDNVGTNGKPLPLGWTGTASGNYTTATSSGVSAPSVALKLNNEVLRTKIYPQPVSKLQFMYRFASANPGSAVIVEDSTNGVWSTIDSIPYVNTNKFYPAYNFTSLQNKTVFRFRFKKIASGNLSIDDVAVTYGNQDTIYLKKDFVTVANNSLVDGLTVDNRYFYNVRAILGTAVSAFSDIMLVNTTLVNAVSQTKSTNIKFTTKSNQLFVSGLKGNETIYIYSLTGVCVYQQKANSTQMNIPLSQHGVYILRIQSQNDNFSSKVVL